MIAVVDVIPPRRAPPAANPVTFRSLHDMDIILGLVIGVCLSAACGFRVFVPLLIMSIANMSGHLELAPNFAWLGSWPALIALSAATIIEIAAYYVPWVDELLDTIATPAAIVAGTIVTASQLGALPPVLQWSIAAITGGGVSTVVQAGSVAARATSTITTGGFGNFIVSTIEDIGAFLVAIFAIVMPILCTIAVALICYKILKITIFRKPQPQASS